MLFFRTLAPAAILLLSIPASGQFTGQIATNMGAGGAAQGATAGAIATLLGPVSDANAKRNVNWEEFQGSPYLSNEFKPTTLFYKDENMGNLFYRYNALNEEVEIKQALTEQGVRGLSRDKNIVLLREGKPMSFKTFIDKSGKTLNGYLTLLMDGEQYDLYKRTHVKYTEGSKAANSFVQATPSRFSHFDEYYVQKKGVNRIDELVQKKSQVYGLDPGQKDALKAFMKENKLDVSTEQDLIRIFEFLDQQS